MRICPWAPDTGQGEAMADLIVKKHPLTRAVHYLFLLPFLPALRPLLTNYVPRDMGVYIGGVVLILFLIIYGNQRPLLKVEDGGLLLFLHYRHNAEKHPFSGILDYRPLGKSRLALDSRDHKTIVLMMRREDRDALIQRLEEEDIHAQKPS